MKRKAEDVVQAYETQRKAIAASCAAYDRGEKWEARRLATAVFMMVHDGGKNHSILTLGGVPKNNIAWAATGREIDDKIMNKSLGSSCLIELDRDKNDVPEFVSLCVYQDRHDFPIHFRFLPFEEWWEKDIIAFESETTPSPILIDLRPPLLRRKLPPLPRGIPPAIASKLIQSANSRRSDDVPFARGWLTKLTRKQLVLALRNQDGGSHFDPELSNPNYRALLRPLHFASFPTADVNECGDRELATMRQIAEELRITLLMAGAVNKGDLPLIEFAYTANDGKGWRRFNRAKEVFDALGAWKKP